MKTKTPRAIFMIDYKQNLNSIIVWCFSVSFYVKRLKRDFGGGKIDATLGYLYFTSISLCKIDSLLIFKVKT